MATAMPEPPNCWQNLPPVTPPPSRAEQVLGVLGNLTELTGSAIREAENTAGGMFSWFGFSRTPGCCARGKPASEADVWDTSSLGWWDFQRRRMTSIWLAKRIYDRTKKAVAGYEALEESGQIEEAEAMWLVLNTSNAKEMREHAEYAKGLFVKATQQMSTMHGVLPNIYLEEFMKTTEKLPVSSPQEVFRVIEEDLQQSPLEIFSEFDQAPVASASIGQVHKGRLKGTEEVVAVKVQHDGVTNVFMEDLTTLAMIAEQVAYWHPGLDLRKAVEEWQDSIPRELDFRDELSAIQRAHSALAACDSPVLVPRPRAELSNQRVLVMDFIEATPICKLTDPIWCKVNGINKTTIMRQLLDAFGILTFRDGLIHGDPHGGNIRLLPNSNAEGGANPVIFDWGMTRMLTDDERISLAKVFHCLANMDVNGLLDALHYLGFRMNADTFTDDIQDEVVNRLRGVMKDTVSKEKTQALTKANINEVKRRENLGKSLGSQKVVTEWPKCIMFFIRMCECVRGLCVMCDAEGLPVLEIFTQHARQAFMEGSRQESITQSVSIFNGSLQRQESINDEKDKDKAPLKRQLSQEANAKQSLEAVPRALLFPPEQAADKMLDFSLEQRVKTRIQALSAKKGVVAAQVAVIQNGRIVCDVAHGTLSSIDMRPVTSQTRFPLLGAVSGVATLALLRDLRVNPDKSAGTSTPPGSKSRPLDMRINQMWPEFAGGESDVTLRELLSHSAGVQDSFPSDFGPHYLNNPSAVAKHFELVELRPAQATRYAFVLQTFLLAKLADCFCLDKKGRGSPFEWLRNSLSPLGLDLAPAGGREAHAVICRDLPSLSRVPLGEVESARAKRIENLEKSTATENGAASESQFAAASPKPIIMGLTEAAMKNPLAFDPLLANISTASDTRGKQFRGGLPFSVSATGFAQMLSSEALREDLDALGALEPQGKDDTTLGWFLTGGACKYGAGGVQLLQAAPLWPKALVAKPQNGYGVVCGLGPCCMHFPTLTEGGLTIAIMVNDVLRGREVAAALAAEVLSAYGYKATWTRMPIGVAAEAARTVRESSMAMPLLKTLMMGTQPSAAMGGKTGGGGGCLMGCRAPVCGSK